MGKAASSSSVFVAEGHYCTPTDMAKRVGLTQARISQLAASGEIRSVKVNGRIVLIPVSEAIRLSKSEKS